MKGLIGLSLLVLLSGVGLGMGQSSGGRGPSTPEERSRFVAITRKLEANPLDRSLDGDRVMAQYLAGVKGALAAYQSILKEKPDAHSKSLDALLQQQSDGKLEDYVRESAKKGCK